MKEALIEKYEEFKNVLDVMPTNNKENKKKKSEYISSEELFNNKLLDLINKEIERRKTVISSVSENEVIQEKETELNNLINTLINEYNTSYEKLELDYYLSKMISYKDDLPKVNDCIRKLINNFKNVGVEITSSMFDYNDNVKSYIEELLNNSDEKILKERFEKIYWKYPELLKTIEISFKEIYLKNKKEIDKFYNDKYNDYLKNNNIKEINDNIISLSLEIDLIKSSDPYLIYNKFMSKEYSLNDYNETTINKKKNTYFGDNFSYENAVKLYRSLYEYNMIIKYNYLLKDMRTRIEEKDTYKGSLDTLTKEIDKLSNKLISLNKTPTKRGLFHFKKDNNSEDDLFEYKEVLKELITKYGELDNIRFNDLIYKQIQKDSTILTVFKFITGNFIYFYNKTKENREELSFDEIENLFRNLNKDILSNRFELLDNIVLLDEKQIKELIVDRYHIDNINISVNDLEVDNVENTIMDINKILIYENILRSSIKFNDIDFMLEVEKM